MAAGDITEFVEVIVIPQHMFYYFLLGWGNPLKKLASSDYVIGGKRMGDLQPMMEPKAKVGIVLIQM